MNLFNRIVVLLLILLTLGGAGLVLALMYGLLAPQQIPAAVATTPLGQWLASFAQLEQTARVVATVVAALVILLMLWLLYLELRPSRRRDDTIVVRNGPLGPVTFRKDSIRDLVLYVTSTIPNVLQVHPRISTRGDGVDVRCRAALTPEADAAQTGAELQERIRTALEQRLGLRVENIDVNTQFQPLTGEAGQAAPRSARRQLR